MVMGVNLGGRNPEFYGGVVGLPWDIIVSYYVQEYEMRTLLKVVTFPK